MACTLTSLLLAVSSLLFTVVSILAKEQLVSEELEQSILSFVCVTCTSPAYTLPFTLPCFKLILLFVVVTFLAIRSRSTDAYPATTKSGVVPVE